MQLHGAEPDAILVPEHVQAVQYDAGIQDTIRDFCNGAERAFKAWRQVQRRGAHA